MKLEGTEFQILVWSEFNLSEPGWVAQTVEALAFWPQLGRFDPGSVRWYLKMLKYVSLVSVDLLARKRTPSGQNYGISASPKTVKEVSGT